MTAKVINVLDHGFVRLVSFMQPAEPEAYGVDSNEELMTGRYADSDWSGDLEIVRNARVSYDADWRTGEDEGKDEKLIRYLIKNKHTSPLEAMAFTFEVKAPIFTFRQWHRHRTWSFNEISARYCELDEGFYVPSVEVIGRQSASNKQMRDIIANISDEELRQREEEIQWVQEHCYAAFTLYRKLMERGWPRELARIVLPFASYSRMFATVDLHNLMHFLRLRLHEHSQHEIRVYAQAILDLITPIVPVTMAAFNDHLRGTL